MTTKQLPKPRARVQSPWRLMEQMNKGWLQLDAPYQRDVVWDTWKMSELIDSIFNNYYIPPLVFAIRKVKGRQTRIVIDGKQRLTSIKMFMDNKIPYIDRSTGEEVEVWYSEESDIDHGEDANYLDENQMNVFNSFEFVCMEYTGITEDDEFDIFSRVQLGVAITIAEKLKAHNTPVARVCRDLSENYKELKRLLNRKSTAQVFHFIAHILLTIKVGREDFKGTPKGLNDFVCDPTYDPPYQLIETLKRTLNTLTALASDDAYTSEFMYRDGKKSAIKVLELLCFAMYIASIQRPRSLKNYAQDFGALRDYLFEKREGKIYISKDGYFTGMQFVEEQLLRYDLVAARPQVYQISDIEDDDDEDLSDELKTDEYEPDCYPTPPIRTATTATELPLSSISSRPFAGKRRRTVAIPISVSNSNHPNISIAKRGRGNGRR